MNNRENNLPIRKTPRLKRFDYNTTGAYFITICTENRAEILSHIVGTGVPDCPYNVELLPYGKIADKYIKQLNDFYKNINIDRYVIMPNHIHILLSLRNGSLRTPTPTARGVVCGDGDVFCGQSGTPVPTNHEAAFAEKVTLFCGSSRTPTPTARGVVCGDGDVFCGQSRTPVPTNREAAFAEKILNAKDNIKANSSVSKFVSTFKRFCNKECGQNIWQDRFYDHVIRNCEDYEEHVKYIYENPKNWYYDELYSKK